MDTRFFARSELGSVSCAVIVSSSVCHGDKKACQLEYSSSLRSKKMGGGGYESSQKTWIYSLNNNGWMVWILHEFNLNVYSADVHH